MSNISFVPNRHSLLTTFPNTHKIKFKFYGKIYGGQTMLELIIAVFPGTAAFLLYKFSHQKFNPKKICAWILFYTVTVNLCIIAGLKLIGMQHFNLFEMSVRFKIKWIILEALLSALLTRVIKKIRETNPAVLKQITRRLFPTAFFFIVTCIIFTPSSLFLGNIDEFSIRYIDIVPILLCTAIGVFAIIFVFAFWLMQEKALPYYMAFIFSVTVAAYIQSNFLNASLPILDGALIQWEKYRTQNLISALVWILCFVFVFSSLCFKKKTTEKFMKYTSLFFSAVQLVSLAVLILMNPLDKNASFGFSKEAEFTVGSKENIIVFVIDTLQEDVMEEYLASDAYKEDGSLDGFILFDNAVSGGASTQFGMSLLLTGMECDPSQKNYLQDAWDETTLYDDLHQNGYDVRLYSEPNEFPGFHDEYFDNYKFIGNRRIEDYFGFGKDLYRLVSCLLMPQFMKESLWLSTDTLLYHIKSTGYELNDIYLHNDFCAVEETLQTDYEKALRIYHMNGVHPTYKMTEDFERVWDNGVTEQVVLRGDMRIIYTYINAMKRAGIFDTSTIIITGDHGRHSDGNPETNPAVLIKFPGKGDLHKLVRSSAPIHFRNIYATIAEAFLEDYSSYGPSVFDITQESDVERLHTVNETITTQRLHLKNYDTSIKEARLIVLGEASEMKYRLWNPYEINCVDYQIGDVIDFTSDNSYADQINYRLYKENDAATASNELSICFHLQNRKSEDLEFHFVYSGIYSDSQKIQVYAGGTKADRIVLPPPRKNKADNEITVKIPKDSIQNECLLLRLVFPNALTPNQLDRNNPDKRVLSVTFDSMWLE